MSLICWILPRRLSTTAAFWLWEGATCGCNIQQIKLIAARPDYVEAYYQLGELYKKQQRPAQAVEALQQALQHQPNHANAHYTLGVIYIELKQYRTAVVEFAAALAARPNFRQAHYSLGVCYEFYLPDIASRCCMIPRETPRQPSKLTRAS